MKTAGGGQIFVVEIGGELGFMCRVSRYDIVPLITDESPCGDRFSFWKSLPSSLNCALLLWTQISIIMQYDIPVW